MISLLALSCNNNDVNPHLLIGSWKLRDVKNITGENITDKVTFFVNDSVSVEIFSKNKLIEQYMGQYTIKEKNKVLAIRYGNDSSINFKILKLTDKEMELQNPNNKPPDRYLRY